MKIGKLDRRILIERKAVTQDAYGAEVVSWSTLATVWGSALDDLGSKSGMEKNREGIRVLEKLTRVVIRYRSDITSNMRIVLVDRSRVMQIVSIAEVGRREGTELMCMEFST